MGAEALIVAVPKFTPVICGGAAGAVAPAAMNTMAGAIVTFDGSLLVKVTVTPPPGAGADKVTGNGTD